MSAPVLIEFRRGAENLVETRHRGTLVVVNAAGTVRWSAGDANAAFALRSTAKPFQLLPFLLDGLHLPPAVDKPLASADLAVLMSSHAGEPMHTRRIAALLDRFGLGEHHLRCGTHPPSDASARDALLIAQTQPGPLHCNCSGKHTAMLAVCARHGWALDTYLDAEHPLQRRIRAILAALAGTAEEELACSVDGCSLPTYWLGLVSLARLFAFLAEPSAAPAVEGRSVAGELALLARSGMARPEMIAGTKRLDTALMRAFPGRVFAKGGAAGLHAMAIAPGAGVPEALGVAIKIDDGDNDGRIRALVAREVLARIGLGPPEPHAAAALESVAPRAAHNFRGLEVGRYAAVF